MVGGIVLAAGAATRMGCTKQLLPWRGKPLVEHVIHQILLCEEVQRPLIVVLGAESVRITRALNDLTGVVLLSNREFQRGMLSSIQAGIRALPSGLDAFFIALGDQPFITPTLFRTAISHFSSGSKPVVVPCYQGSRGHPVIVCSSLRNDILDFQGEGGLREFFRIHCQGLVDFFEVTEPGILVDLDYPEDYARYREVCQQSPLEAMLPRMGGS